MLSANIAPLTTRRLASAATVAVVVGAVAGCGGSSHKSSSTTKSTTSTPAVTKPKRKPTLTEAARLDKAKAKYQSVQPAHLGDVVEFRTIVPGKITAGPETVGFKIAEGGGRITVTATAKSQTSSATVAGPSNAVLSAIHYQCALPPTPSYCPVQKLSHGTKGYQFQFSVKPHTPIVLAGKLASSTTPPARKLRPTSSAVVAAYRIIEKVRAVTPGKTATGVFTPTAAAHPGDVVVMSTHVSGKVSGAPQRVTITVEQGPGSSLKASASAPGGATSTATLTAAGAAKIALVSPHYSCFLPPFPTFCPTKGVKVAGKRYQITFAGTPNTSPILIVARIQRG